MGLASKRLFLAAHTISVAEHRERDLVARVATKSCQLHHFVIALSTHPPENCPETPHVVTSRTAQANLSRFQQWLTQTSPVCQRHCVFLSTRVHDHIQQVFHIRQTGYQSCRRQTERRNGIPEMSQNRRCPHVFNFSLLFRLRRFHLESPSTCVPTRRSTHLGQMFTFATEDCNIRFRRGQSGRRWTRPVHNNSTCLCFHGSCRLCQNSCHCCSRDLTCHQISQVVCTIALRCRSLAIIEALRIAESTPRFLSCPALPQQAHTLTSRHQFTLAWADCTSPPSFASTDPHLHATLARFVEHADLSVVPEIVPWPSPEQQYVSVSRASSPNDVIFTCLVSFSHLSHLFFRLSEDVHWN